MDIDRPLFEQPFRLASDEGDVVWVRSLDRESAQAYAASLVTLHCLIPFVHWTQEDILSDQIGTRVFQHKWKLSILITGEAGEPVGFLVSYLRVPDDNFDSVSVYMHRMAILSRLQRRGIGRQVIEAYLKRVFEVLPVDYVTLQANDNAANARIVGLYERLGFRKIKHVRYSNKIDWLMACPRVTSWQRWQAR